ncbi:hypothetical protein LAZ67_7001564 [Cordylochernes scorpioides]|uniref:Uncharacterized protein n=1 Tax=Cordylochernes scorpioides TaxID=51811 RepID=A0ABY6KNZ4_9ARAC|nr:hypothetical protein LAZ67_7001564 [Cordylochernes scorpioides]
MCKYQNLMAKISPLGNYELFQFWKEKNWTPFWKLIHPKKKKSLKNGKKDAQAKGILTCSITNSLVALIPTCKTTKEIWKTLHAKYEGDKRKIIIEARNDVSRLIIKKEEKWEDYLYRAERHLEKARNLGADIEDEEFITSVIRGLPHEYNLISGKLGNVHTKNEDTVALRKFREQIKVELGAKDGEIEVFLLVYMMDEMALSQDGEFSSTSLHLVSPLKVLTEYRQSWSRQSGKLGNVYTKNEDTVALRKFREQIKVELGAKDGEIEVFLLVYMMDEMALRYDRRGLAQMLH